MFQKCEMSTGPSVPSAVAAGNNLFAAVDMGTNSFKLTTIRIDPSSGRIITVKRLKEPVLLGLDIATTSSSSATTISTDSLERAISALKKFQDDIQSDRRHTPHLRLVATSAVREASNKSQFIETVKGTLGLRVEVISGAEEARLIYLGVLQFFPVFTSTVLTIDIGGGSTEFTVGFKGNVLYSKSLRLGHVTLTAKFTDAAKMADVAKMRDHIRNELETSGLIKEIIKYKLDCVIGSSGTIKAIEKAVCKGYALKVEENVGVLEEFVNRDWRFTRGELGSLVKSLCDDEMEGRLKRKEFFERRAPFILAGTILLDEIFKSLGIEEIEVSGYALAEGVITEMIGDVFKGLDLNANARWRSVIRLASRFNNKKRMKAAMMCSDIAKEVFEGLRKLHEVRSGDKRDDELSVSLDDRDLEWLDAACLLHSIGLYTGKKGYHKKSYRLIVDGNDLHGYTQEEIKLIALLVRYHRKKNPKKDVPEGSSKEVKQKFRVLCTIMRVSCALQQCLPVNFQFKEFLDFPGGFKLVFSEGKARKQSTNVVQPLAAIIQQLGGDINDSLEKELEQFRMVFKRNLSIVVA